MKPIETLEKLGLAHSFEDSENFSIILQFLHVWRFMTSWDTHVIIISKFQYHLSKLQAPTMEVLVQNMHKQLRLELGKFGKLRQSSV